MRSIVSAAILLSTAASVHLPGVDRLDRDHARAPQGACPAQSVTSTGDTREAQALAGIAQRLLDAVGAGDSVTWSRYLDGDGIFTDEDGNVRNKLQVIAELRPLPTGISGRVCVSDPRAIVRGNVAVLTYDALETATVYGQVVHTHYHTTDTYARRNGAWRLLASHVAVLPSEHPLGTVASGVMNDFVGRYALAPGVEYLVERDGNRLFGRRTGGQREELLPLGGDQFFRSGARRGERIFRRDATGRVDAMLDRRDNNDLVWRRELSGRGSKAP